MRKLIKKEIEDYLISEFEKDILLDIGSLTYGKYEFRFYSDEILAKINYENSEFLFPFEKTVKEKYLFFFSKKRKKTTKIGSYILKRRKAKLDKEYHKATQIMLEGLPDQGKKIKRKEKLKNII